MRSSKNCDLQFANSDRLKENDGIGWSETPVHVLGEGMAILFPPLGAVGVK